MLDKDRLKMCRKECKLTQQQVADLIGVDRSAYAYYELGVSSPSAENLFRLAAIFKVDANWLMGMAGDSDSLKSPEGGLMLLKAVKEKSITELSKEERQFVALFRLADAGGKKEQIVKAVNIALEEKPE